MHNLIDIDIILKPGIVASVEVEFGVSSHGYGGSFDEPPCPAEYYITGIVINNVMCFSGIGIIIPRVWHKTNRELVQQGWHDALCKRAKPLLENDYYDEWQRLADHEFNIEPSPC